MISAVKHAASIRNPEFDARQRARRSTWNTPRFLYSYDKTADGDLVLPRGLHSLLTELVDSADSRLRINDKRALGAHHDFVTCATTLRATQSAALLQILAEDAGVLITPPGTGMNRPRFYAHFLWREGWADVDQVRREYEGQGGAVVLRAP